MTPNRRSFVAMLCGGTALTMGATALAYSPVLAAMENALSGPTRKRRKFLFIAVDDLRPMMGHYGDKGILTPQLDAFAGHALSFDNAYTQVATCGASRGALFTALRPTTTNMITHNERIEERVPGRPYLHTSFTEAGFHTASMGKILHHASDAADGWSEPPYMLPTVRHKSLSDEMNLVDSALDRRSGDIWARDAEALGRARRQPAVEAADVPDSAYQDGQMAEHAIAKLQEFAADDRDFFMAVGFAKPHLPFNAPKRYWDWYDRKKITLFERPTHVPEGAPDFAVSNSGELKGYAGIPLETPFDEDKTRELTHGYMACVSYVDAQIGKVLEAVRELGMWDDVVIALWGDHGYKLGDYGSWTKHTNFEIDTRVPLMLRVPGLTDGGDRTDALVETVDIFPTLLQLAEIPVPQGLEGVGFADVLSDPDKPWKSATFSQFPRNHSGVPHMGYAVRTRTHRYVGWRNLETDTVIAEELYDLVNDPLETRNLADHPEYQTVKRELRLLRDQGWQAALPPGSSASS